MSLYSEQSYISKLLSLKPFEQPSKELDRLFLNAIKESMRLQIEMEPVFSRWISSMGTNIDELTRIEDVPYFPASIFKLIHFASAKNISRTLRSSGTTSQLKSTIHLDSETSRRQTKVLARILTALLGSSRRPFLIFDAEPKIKTSDVSLSARVAGMSGYLMAAKSRNFVGRSSGNTVELDRDALFKALDQYENSKSPPVIIGYTYMIHKLMLEDGIDLRGKLPIGTSLIHFGGWKKLKDKKIPKAEFNNRLNVITGISISQIFDIYGFTEQLGSVYPSIGNSPAKVPTYSRVIVRDPTNLKVITDGREGLLQFLSPIPNSYPGQSILNDDIGTGSVNTTSYCNEFWVHGRPEKAISRGCGDTLPKDFYL